MFASPIFFDFVWILVGAATVTLIVLAHCWLEGRLALGRSSRAEAAAAVKAAEEKYRGIFENALWGIFQTTPEGRYLSANPALARMYCYDTPEQLKNELNDIGGQLYIDPRRRIDFADLIQRHDVVTGFESLIRRRDGSQIWISENARAIRSSEGKLLYYEGTVEDITRRKETEELRRETEAAQAANVAKSAFLANMSHEIRTPLNGVIGTLDLMAGTPLDTRQQRYLRVCRSSAQSLLTLINDVLDFSKIEAGKLELTNVDFQLDTLVDDVLEMFAPRAQQKGLEIAARLAPDVPLALRGDPDRLRQILLNLMGNAIKFTEQGEIIIRIERERHEAERVRLKFEVTDTGIGIPAERLDRLFRAFSQVDASTTRKYGGTGLGLAICKQLVELMSGKICVTSKPGEGSTFVFSVELGCMAEACSLLEAPPKTLQGLRVLVVDDNETNLHILQEQLSLWGLAPVVTSDPRGSIDHLREAAKEGQPFGLAILDHQMPDLDGMQLAAQIRAEQELSRTPLLMLTSLGHALANDEVSRRGLAGYITKPVRNSQLLDAIMNAIETTRRLQMARLDGSMEPAQGEAESIAPTVKKPSPTPITMRPKQPSAAAVNSKKPSEPAAGRLLLAEDNEVNQMVASEILERAGYEVHVVGNGRLALEAIMSQAFDLVLMDCQMPEMDGFEATSLIRQLETDGALQSEGDSLPVVALTANAFDVDRQRCKEAGMTAHVSKPIDPRSLIGTIENLIGSRRRRAEGRRAIRESTSEYKSSLAKEHPSTIETKKALPGVTRGQPEPANILETEASPFAMNDLLVRCLGDDTLVQKVMGKFLQQLPKQLEQLRTALDGGEIETAGRVAHTLKGAAANLAAGVLRDAAAKIEAACREKDLAAARGGLTAVMEAAAACERFAAESLATA